MKQKVWDRPPVITLEEVVYVNAKSMLEVVEREFVKFGFPLVTDRGIVPDDESTVFVCSGMQKFKGRFLRPDGLVAGSIQSCIRTNDLDLVGDGTHLTYFEMLGNFSFGGPEYSTSILMWDSILKELQVKPDWITVHPSRPDHEFLWKGLGYEVRPDPECEWTDGNIGGHCCEVFVDGLEIGNLVNTLGHSTDVGFGLERLVQVIEGKKRVDQTTLFRQDLPPVVADHVRALDCLWGNGVVPGSKGRNGMCRKLLRRVLDDIPGGVSFEAWLAPEKKLREDRVKTARKMLRRHKGKPEQFWWETFGVILSELDSGKVGGS